MNKNLSIIVSYHDLSKVPFEFLQGVLGELSPNVYYIDNNTYRSDELQKLVDVYGHMGVQFDEFNAQSIVPQINDGNEYVYHTHYRRFLHDVHSDTLILEPKTVYAIEEEFNLNLYFHMREYVFGEDIRFNDTQIQEMCKIYQELFDIPMDLVHDIVKHTATLPREIYICHKDVQKEMLEFGYKFIKLFCERFPTHIKNKNRCVGMALENFISFFFRKKEKCDGYKLILKQYIQL